MENPFWNWELLVCPVSGGTCLAPEGVWKDALGNSAAEQQHSLAAGVTEASSFSGAAWQEGAELGW